jgi:hypothetical protein
LVYDLTEIDSDAYRLSPGWSAERVRECPRLTDGKRSWQSFLREHLKKQEKRENDTKSTGLVLLVSTEYC